MIRSGEELLVAQGVFNVNEEQKRELFSIDVDVEDDEVIIRRTLDIKGKEKSFVNGVRVPRTKLKEVMKTLVDIVGQHSHQMLLNKENHIKLLDKFIDEDSKEIRVLLEASLENYLAIDDKIKNIEKEKKETSDKKEFYEFQLNEIQSANLKSEEDVNLENEYKILFNAGKIKEKLSISQYNLKHNEKNALSFIYSSKKNIESLLDYGKEFEDIYEQLEKIYYELEDCVSSIEDIESGVEIDEGRLEKVVERLNLIEKLKSKYGDSIEEVIEYGEDLNNKLKTLDDSNFQTNLLLKEKEKFQKEYWEQALKLREIRRKYITKIQDSLGAELAFLNMKDAKLEIKLEEKEGMSKNGSDSIEFFITTNAGQLPKPLQKIASGGEVSRIMLALKVIFSHVDNIPILIFDEIDTGVGGETVRKIADKLAEIGSNAQVICITHSPAIASKAKEQYYIKKFSTDGRTSTTVKKLSEEERIKEIARMLAGDSVSEAVLSHAKELLKKD